MVAIEQLKPLFTTFLWDILYTLDGQKILYYPKDLTIHLSLNSSTPMSGSTKKILTPPLWRVNA